jgi:translation initiation factor 3 subunit L
MMGVQNFLPAVVGSTRDSIDVDSGLEQVWNVVGVLNYLQALIEKSMILQILEEEKEGNVTFTATDGYDYHGGTNVLKVLGYFSIVGLLRVHCLLGDYHSGLRALSPIDINQPGVFNTVIGCQITTIYYYGFANLMLRRYCLWHFLILESGEMVFAAYLFLPEAGIYFHWFLEDG